jgi:hypothetical protein
VPIDLVKEKFQSSAVAVTCPRILASDSTDLFANDPNDLLGLVSCEVSFELKYIRQLGVEARYDLLEHP